MNSSGGRIPPLPGPAFLERGTYRRRRLMDAARLLPVLGLFLFAIPLLWANDATTDPEPVLQTSYAVLYVFGMWVLLVILAAIISRRLFETDPPKSNDDTAKR